MNAVQSLPLARPSLFSSQSMSKIWFDTVIGLKSEVDLNKVAQSLSTNLLGGGDVDNLVLGGAEALREAVASKHHYSPYALLQGVRLICNALEYGRQAFATVSRNVPTEVKDTVALVQKKLAQSGHEGMAQEAGDLLASTIACGGPGMRQEEDWGLQLRPPMPRCYF